MKIPANELRALSLWVVIVPLVTINIYYPSDNTVAWNAFVMVSAYYAVMARILWHHGYSGGRLTSPSHCRNGRSVQ